MGRARADSARQSRAGNAGRKAGLKKGDLLVSVNGQAIHSQIKFQEITKNSNGKPIEIEYIRDGQTQVLSVQPGFTNLDGPSRWMIGVLPVQKFHIITTQLSLPKAFDESLTENGKNATLLVNVIKGMLERRISTKNLSGPIGIGGIVDEDAQQGPSESLQLMAV